MVQLESKNPFRLVYSSHDVEDRPYIQMLLLDSQQPLIRNASADLLLVIRTVTLAPALQSMWFSGSLKKSFEYCACDSVVINFATVVIVKGKAIIKEYIGHEYSQVASYKLLEWWSEDDTSSVSLLSSLSSIWYVVTSWLLDLWAWFDGSWLWAPWTSVAAWLQTSEDPITEDQPVDYSTEAGIEVDWNAALTWPFTTASSIFSSAGDYLGTAASYLGDTVVVVFSAAGSFLSTVVAWVVDCLLAVPALLSSVLAFLAYPFKSMKWDYTAPVDYTVPVPSAPYSTGSPEPDASLDRLLGDRQALAGLVRHLLASEEFARALDQRQVESSLHKIQLEFSKVREELSDRISTEESSVETKMDSLKQQIQELQMALLAHKTLVSEQAALGNRLEARVTSAEQLHTREGEGELLHDWLRSNSLTCKTCNQHPLNVVQFLFLIFFMITFV
ncbi:hypothetical protein J6590_046292 [Homalodisca vitripennis]|nr:hypothetical protein J6590_046292 [Homalodisca vitripennis]